MSRAIIRFSVFCLSILLLCFWIGSVLAGRTGFLLALAAFVTLLFLFYSYSSFLILNKFRAEEISAENDPVLYGVLEELSPGGLVKIYRIPSLSPNAMACGVWPQKAAIALTEGLLRSVEYEELKAIIAFELNWLKQHEAFPAGAAAMIGGLLEPSESQPLPQRHIFARTIHMLRRQASFLIVRGLRCPPADVYNLDKKAALSCSSPLYLLSALQKIEAGQRKYVLHETSISTAPLFIVNPLAGQGLRETAMLPLLEERMVRLLA